MHHAPSARPALVPWHVLDDAVAVGDTAAEPDRWNAYFLAGLAMWLVILAADWLSDDTILIPLLIVVPLLTAVGGSVRETAIVGSVAVLTAVALGWVDDIAGSRRHWVGIAATVLASGLGLWLAARRAAHERQIDALAQAREQGRSVPGEHRMDDELVFVDQTQIGQRPGERHTSDP